MVTVRDPILTPVAIKDLRPTQITVGMFEVKDRRKHVRRQTSNKIGKFLGAHMIPVILGPKKRHYVVDHHHLSLALHQEGLENVLVTVIADLSSLDDESFWVVLDSHGWVHPYDARGRRRDFSEIPKSIMELRDDPFRSLAGELRRAGGYAKDTTPFSEFLWADFLRRRMSASAIKRSFSAALKKAMKMAKSQEAHYLPGWCGPIEGGSGR
ncbi:MAG: ParB-like protein [Rhizomicrobium sp.]